MSNKGKTTKENKSVSVEQQTKEILSQVKTGRVYQYYNAAVDRTLPQEEQDKIFLDWLKIFAETKVFQLMKKDKSELTRADLEYMMDCCQNTALSSSDKVQYIRQGWVADLKEIFNKYLIEVYKVTTSPEESEDDYYDEEYFYRIIYAVNDFKAYELIKNQYGTEYDNTNNLLTYFYVSLQKIKELDISNDLELNDKMYLVDVVYNNPTICDLDNPETLLINMSNYFNSQSEEVKKEVKEKLSDELASEFLTLTNLLTIYLKHNWSVNKPDVEKEYFNFACNLFEYLFGNTILTYGKCLKTLNSKIQL